MYSSLVQNPGNHTLYDYGDKPVLQQVPAEGGAAVNATFDISYGFAGSNVKGLVGYEVNLPSPVLLRHVLSFCRQ